MAIKDDDIPGREHALDGTGEGSSGILLRGVGGAGVRRELLGGEVVDSPADGLRLVRYQVQAVLLSLRL